MQIAVNLTQIPGVVKSQRQHNIWIRLRGGGFMGVECSDTAQYSAMMEREFNYELLKLEHGDTWRTHSYKIVKEKNPLSYITERTEEESRRMAMVLIDNHLANEAREILERK